MDRATGTTPRSASTSYRTCARRGCDAPVKKPTAKYCSVRCCALDPERQARLRVQARRHARSTVVPMSRQLAMPFNSTSIDVTGAAVDPEALIARLCEGRDDVPRGLSRFVG